MLEGIAFIRDLVVITLSATAGGWLARRLRLSPIVGYLAAGLVVGTPQITVVYVTDPDRIHVLSQIGLIFLMFAIGLRVRLRQISELGLGPMVATILTALLMLSLGRLVGGLLGLDQTQGLFFAAMLVISSSAIIGKVLAEHHLLHQRTGQLALSQTLLEDFVAIILLAVLGSLVAYEQPLEGGGMQLMISLAKLGGFVLLLLLTGLVLLPRLLLAAERRGGEELEVLLVGALLLAFALLSVLAGYSLALGAFLFGVLVSETPRSRFVTRAFVGMRDIFTAIFFVAIGMSINLAVAPAALDLILVGTALAIFGRVACALVSWMVACETAPNALRTALTVTPIGEFSFIIAGLGVASGVLPERFQIAAVGISFLTSLVAPVLVARADTMARFVTPRKAGRLQEFLESYRGIWTRLREKGRSHMLWKFLRKRIWQMARELGWVAAVLVFAQPMYSALREADWATATGWQPLLPWFWLLVFLLLLVPMVSLIRNIQAVAILLVDYFSGQVQALRKRRWFWTFMIQMSGILLLLLVLFNVLPWTLFEPLTLALLLGVPVVTMLIGWNRLIRLHSHAEIRFQEVWEGDTPTAPAAWTTAGRDWGFILQEWTIPENFAAVGQTLREVGLRQKTGATIVGIQRQGVQLDQPGPTTHLFPDDHVFLLGGPEQVQQATEVLGESGPAPAADLGRWERAILEGVLVPADSAVVGRPLSALQWPRLLGVQVVAARQGGHPSFTPKADWVVQGNTEILLAGSPSSIREVKRQLLQADSDASVQDRT